ncbi:hypothetical protein Bbelb_397310 [Branchiostoma belcheri]|nr:hypothetical protein Bbelb_397310 [Branchiostoma belcheri]
MTSGIGIVGPDRSQLTLVSSSITCSKLPLATWALTKCEKTKADNRLASVKVSVGFGWTPKGIFVKYSPLKSNDWMKGHHTLQFDKNLAGKPCPTDDIYIVCCYFIRDRGQMTNVWFYWSKSTQLTSHMVTVLHQLTNQPYFLARYGPARDQQEIAKQLRTGDPKLVNVHCIAHRLTLAAGQAATVIPYLLKFKDLMGQLYRFYENSACGGQPSGGRGRRDNLQVDRRGTKRVLISARSWLTLPDGSFNFQVDGSFDVLDPNRNLEGIIGDVSVEDNLPVEEGGRRETSALRRYWRETESIGGGTADITRTSWLGSDGAAAMVGRNKGMVRTTSKSTPKHRQCPTDFDDLLFTEVMDTLNHNERPVCTKACEKGDHHVRSTFDALCQEASNAHDERIDRLITYKRLVQTFPLAQDYEESVTVPEVPVPERTIPGFSGRDRQTPKGGDTRSEVSNRAVIQPAGRSKERIRTCRHHHDFATRTYNSLPSTRNRPPILLSLLFLLSLSFILLLSLSLSL